MGIFNFFKKKSSSTKEEGQNDFANEMTANASFFKEKHENRYNGLDFSIKSLNTVDQILEDASEFYDEMNEDQKRNIISKTGSYVFEVARQNFGGKYFWYNDLNQPILVTGQPEFEMSLLAFEKIKGRLENGIEDNIPFFFEGYIDGVKNKRSQMIV